MVGLITIMAARGAITITASQCVENFVGMEKIGQANSPGFTLEDLEAFYSKLPGSELIRMPCPVDLNITANILIIRNGVRMFHVEPEQLYNEMAALNWDTKGKQRGKVVNKHARYNLCFSYYSQEPDYESGKGRVIDINSLVYLKHIMSYLHLLLNDKAKGINAEGNYYFDTKKCYIGYHGDGERKMVIGIRIGEPIPLYYQWYQDSKKIGEEITLNLNEGDIYVMDEKATGNDWKKRIIPTVRHAAGCRNKIK